MIIHRIKSIFRYLIKGKTNLYIHSPFVFEWMNNVLFDKRIFYAFVDIEFVKKKLYANRQTIDVIDFGAGSKSMPAQKRFISDIAKNAAIPTKYGRLLFRIVNNLQPNYVVELGTSLGISTLYMAMAKKSATIYTIEGCKDTAQVAQQCFNALNCQNIKQFIGNFDDILPNILLNISTIDLLYVDGNHTYAATMRYFNLCLSKATPNSIFIFDDIHWSEEMEQAWNEIKLHPKVTLTIDLYRIGIVWFKLDQVKENFILYF